MLTRDDASIWPGMTDPVKALVKNEMLACIREEQMRAVTKKVSSTCPVAQFEARQATAEGDGAG